MWGAAETERGVAEAERGASALQMWFSRCSWPLARRAEFPSQHGVVAIEQGGDLGLVFR
jgi:hypothetical protein